MTVKAEAEERVEPALEEASKPRVASAGARRPFVAGSAAARETTQVAPFSAKHIYLTFGFYSALLASGIWASINVLNWVWHKLL